MAWSHLLATSALPVAATSLHTTLATLATASTAAASLPPESGAPGAAEIGVSPSEGDTLFAVETLRLLVVMASSVTALGQRAQETVLEVRAFPNQCCSVGC